MNWKMWKKNSKNIAVIAYMGLMPLVCSSIITAWSFENQEWFYDLGWQQWLFIGIGTVVTMGLAMTPTTFVALIFGYFLGLPSIFILFPAYILASVLGYFVGKKVDGGGFLQTFDKSNKAEQIFAGLKKNEFLLVAMARLSPVLPFAVMNVVLSVGGASLKKFIVAGSLGMLPRTLLSIFLGSQSHDIVDAFTHTGNISLTQVLVFVLFIVSSVGMVFVGKKAISFVNE